MRGRDSRDADAPHPASGHLLPARGEKGHRSRERGASCAEGIFIVLVLLVVFALIWYFAQSCGPKPSASPVAQKKAPPPPRYRCLTTPDGLVPIKAVIARPDGVMLGNRRAAAMESFIAVRQDGDFYELGTDPMSGKSIGRVHKRDLLLWATKEGLQPNRANPDRKPLLLWEDKRHIGNENEEYFEERADAAVDEPYPVLEVDDGRYLIALKWQSEDYENRGVTKAWTSRVNVPDDVRFYYRTTKDDVRQLFENVNQSLLELSSGGASDHPLIAFFKEHVGVTVGEEIEAKNDDLPTLRRVLRDLRNPISIAEKQPAEIKRDAERMRRDLKRLRDFYQNPDHWNERGEGWLPREYLPGR